MAKLFFYSFRKIKETAFISEVFFQYLRYFVITGGPEGGGGETGLGNDVQAVHAG